ncbi:MAG: hypothetical protein ACLFPA_12105, partial [Dichotomicrobium sp.]
MRINIPVLNELAALCLGVALAVGLAPTAFATDDAPEQRADTGLPVQRDVSALPAPVQDMRVSILRAASSGDLEEMRYVLERNEIMPVLTAEGTVEEPLTHFRRLSGDGEGLEVMAALIEILTSGHVVKEQPDTEMYVWPHFAERGVADLTPAERVELYRLVSPEEAERMAEEGYD